MRDWTLLLALLLPQAAHGDTRAVLSSLIGHSEAELIQRLGPPSDAMMTVDGERLFYDRLDIGEVDGRSGDNTRAGGPGDVGLFPRKYSFRCRTEVVIRNDRVQAYNRTGTDCR